MIDVCCICGKELPNRWAVAGRCKAKGCPVPFCKLHWRNGNKYCREHGWQESKPAKQNWMRNRDVTNAKENEMNEKQTEQMDLSNVPEKQGKKAVAEALKVAKAAGAGVVGLVAKIQYARSPQAMQDTLNENIEKNQERRGEVSKELEKAHNRIIALKQQYETASAVRKHTLQLELKMLMGEYKSLEAEFKILLENETVLGKVRGRFMETLAYDLRQIKEKNIDKIADRIEAKVDESEGVLDAMVDLEAAGHRVDRDEDNFDFDAELSAFGDEEIKIETEAPATLEGVSEETPKKEPLDGLEEFE